MRKVRSIAVQGVVYPLITRSDGSKFGKTADGDTVWLDATRTSPYNFYQFFMNMEDAKVAEMLNFYTFLSQAEIGEFAQMVADRPHLREAQRKLAQEVTRMVHGESGLAKAEQATQVLFGGAIEGLGAGEIRDIFASAPSTQLAKSAFEGEGVNIADLLVTAGAAKSKGEGRRLIESGGIYLNNQRVAESGRQVVISDSIQGQYLVVRKGKKEYFLVQING